jgi:hypothetical protein
MLQPTDAARASATTRNRSRLIDFDGSRIRPSAPGHCAVGRTSVRQRWPTTSRFDVDVNRMMAHRTRRTLARLRIGAGRRRNRWVAPPVRASRARRDPVPGRFRRPGRRASQGTSSPPTINAHVTVSGITHGYVARRGSCSLAFFNLTHGQDPDADRGDTDRAGLPRHRLYALRHTFACHLLADGRNP